MQHIMQQHIELSVYYSSFLFFSFSPIYSDNCLWLYEGNMFSISNRSMLPYSCLLNHVISCHMMFVNWIRKIQHKLNTETVQLNGVHSNHAMFMTATFNFYSSINLEFSEMLNIKLYEICTLILSMFNLKSAV